MFNFSVMLVKSELVAFCLRFLILLSSAWTIIIIIIIILFLIIEWSTCKLAEKAKYSSTKYFPFECSIPSTGFISIIVFLNIAYYMVCIIKTYMLPNWKEK